MSLSAHTYDRLSEIELQILHSVQDIKYGSVEILIHDSRIVQIEKSEKFRFDARKAGSAD
jgi:hypothetical protein